jgi:hypothetical protein
MGAATLDMLVATAAGVATAALRLWTWERVAKCRAREAARRDHVRHLPPGSRLVEPGRHGIVIHVGAHQEPSGAGR